MINGSIKYLLFLIYVHNWTYYSTKTHLRSPTIKSLGWIDKFTRTRHPYYTYNILQWPFCPGLLFQIKLLWPVVTGHNIWDIKERLFSDRGRHSSLWPRATTRGKLQNWDNMIINNTQSSRNLLYTHLESYSYGDHIVSIYYSKPNIHGQRPQLVVAWPLNLRGHREVICGLKIPEIIVAEGHSI